MSLYVFACMSWWILNSRLANFWERNLPFVFLLVVFWLWCRCFKCVLLSLWYLGRKMFGNYIDYWSVVIISITDGWAWLHCLPFYLCLMLMSQPSVLAGLGSSVGCAVRLETRRSRVQPPPRAATFFRGDWSWNIFYGHSLPSADSRRAVVSFWRKNVHKL